MNIELSERQKDDLLKLNIGELIDRTVRVLDTRGDLYNSRIWMQNKDSIVHLFTQVREELFNERKRAASFR